MSRKPNSGKRTNLSQFGLIDIPSLDDDEPMEISDNDEDLEAELAAITGGGGAKKRRPKKADVAAMQDLDAMIAASLRDVPSDDEGSGDDDDPDLLNELNELSLDDEAPRLSRPAPPPPGSVSTESSVISLLQERISNYTIAEKSAKDSGESTRARRFSRGLKTLNDLLKQAKAGRPIKDEDIPPPVSVGKPAEPAAAPALPSPDASQPLVPMPPTRRAPAPPPRTESLKQERPPTPPEPVEPPPQLPVATMDPAKEEGLKFILKRKEEFKSAALASKHAGDKAMALEFLKVVKQFEIVVDAYKAGQEMDLNELPTVEAITVAVRSQTTEEQTQNSAAPAPEPSETGALITATSVGEALKQRLAAFQEQESNAKEQGNSSKARRMGRIVKQYQEAIKLHAAGKPLPLDELPTPNGYGPIPGASSQPLPSAASPPKPSPQQPSPQLTRNDKQLLLLMHKQKEYKEAALKAKKNGNIDQAKEYLRAAKGFDTLIEAARGGLPVDMKSIPLPPGAHKRIEETFDVISSEDCEPASSSEAPVSLQQQLASQLRVCASSVAQCRAAGRVADAHRLERLAQRVQQDMAAVALADSLNQPPPKFHFESRQFSIVQCNTDLNENDLEITIVRGIAYNVPNPREVDTYVKFDFPYPQDAPVSDRTGLIKDTNSPRYDAVFVPQIQRQQRACQRVFKRHAVKFEVYSRGGWFSRDMLLGTVLVKLAPLEGNITLHEAFPLMDGRRPAGGALEVKLRVRTPLLQPQVDHTTHRWLVLDD